MTLREVTISCAGSRTQTSRASPPTSPSAAWRRATRSSARAPAASPSSSSSRARRASSVGGEEVATLKRGEYVGELALLDPEGPRSATVTAKTDVVLAAMSAWQFRPFVLAHPEVAWTLLQRLARRLREAQTPVSA